MKLPAVLSLGLKWSAGRVELVDHSLLFRPHSLTPLALMAIVLSPAARETGMVFILFLGGKIMRRKYISAFECRVFIDTPITGGLLNSKRNPLARIGARCMSRLCCSSLPGKAQAA